MLQDETDFLASSAAFDRIADSDRPILRRRLNREHGSPATEREALQSEEETGGQVRQDGRHRLPEAARNLVRPRRVKIRSRDGADFFLVLHDYGTTRFKAGGFIDGRRDSLVDV